MFEKTKIYPYIDEITKFLKNHPTASSKELSDLIHNLTQLSHRQSIKLAKRVISEFSSGLLDKKNSVESQEVKTLDDLLKVCKVDTNKWDVSDFAVEKTDGSNKDGSVISKFKVRANLEKKETEVIENVLEHFIKEAGKYSPREFKFNKVEKNDNIQKNKLLEINIPDAHLNRLGWGYQNLAGNYDLKIACKVYTEAAFGLLNKVPLDKVDRVLLIIGNDFFNIDNLSGSTTALTPQENDTRFQKMFVEGSKVLVNIIDYISNYYTTDVIIVFGNHDTSTVQLQGEYLKAWFRNKKTVSIDNSPSSRKYYRYGKNLNLYSHGKEEKLSSLPNIMMVERRKDCGETLFHEIHIAHTHQEHVSEINGVKIRTVPSIAEIDNWTSKKGFVGNKRCAQAFLYDKENGLDAIYYYNIK